MTTITNVATAAAKLATRDASRAKAHEALMTIMDQIDNGIPIDTASLAVLYKQFMPKAGKRPATTFDWLARAAAKDDVRKSLNFVKVENGVGYGTDGHRIHKATGLDLADGFYDKAGAKVFELDGRQAGADNDAAKQLHGPFFDYERPIPAWTKRAAMDPPTFFEREVALADVQVVPGGRNERTGKPAFHYVQPAGESLVAVNHAYWVDAVAMEASETVTIFAGKPTEGGVGMDLPGNRTAYIMGIRI